MSGNITTFLLDFVRGLDTLANIKLSRLYTLRDVSRSQLFGHEDTICKPVNDVDASEAAGIPQVKVQIK